jgi:hypothetical protein
MMIMPRRLALAFALLLLPCISNAHAAPLPAVPAAMKCDALTNVVMSIPNEAPLRVTHAEEATQGTAAPFCRVQGYVAPQVAFELHLPLKAWTQRLLFTGCGGFCGRVVRPNVPATDGCAAFDDGTFALAMTDMGHTAPQADTVWADNNPQGRIDFGYRAVHVVTLASKLLIERFYGQVPKYAYFSGCSDGGREAMMEAERYPEDYNGIISGSSMVNATMNNSLYHVWVMQHLMRRDGSLRLTDAQLKQLHAAVLSVCAKANEADSDLVIDPSTCHFDPAMLECGKAASPCFNVEQVADIRALYQGPVDSTGRALYFGLPPGSELNWNAQADNSKTYAATFLEAFSGPRRQAVDLWAVTFDDAMAKALAQTAREMNSTDPNLKAFSQHGGKVILWHGWSDTGVPPFSSVAFARAVQTTVGQAETDKFLKLYMLPGVYHCGNGPGADKMDLLTEITRWVEDGVAPAQVEARKRVDGAVTRRRTIAPYR